MKLSVFVVLEIIPTLLSLVIMAVLLFFKSEIWYVPLIIGLLIQLIMMGYRTLSYVIGFLNEVKPMLIVSDRILKEISKS